jgi:hypothetical protein
MCPWFNSKRYHFLLSFNPVLAFRGAGFFFILTLCFTQIAQITQIACTLLISQIFPTTLEH